MWLLFLLLFCGVANADVYVVTNPQNGVYSLSDVNDAVIPSGYKLTVLKGQNIANLPISGNPQLYNFSNGAFTLNATAVQAQQAVEAQAIATQTASDNAKASAIAKFKALGLTDSEIEAITR